MFQLPPSTYIPMNRYLPQALFIACIFTIQLGISQDIPVPTIQGEWWSIANNPDLGEYSSDRQEPVDFGIWQAADGTWQLWSCIRKTNCPGEYTQRLLHGWEGKSLFDTDWESKGVTWLAKPELGEVEGGMQAPHVIWEAPFYYLFYGDWRRICLAKSTDGKNFSRVLGGNGQPDLFTEDALETYPNNTARDAMVLKRGNTYYCYYTSHTSTHGQDGAAYCRTSLNLRDWSESVMVSHTPEFPGNSPKYSDECPHVVYVPEVGLYYLFVTQMYGKNSQTTVYASPNPLYFGIDSDVYKVCSLPIAAPEVILFEGKYYVAALKPGFDGIQIAELTWE